jgi:hypothetical protein
MKRMTNALMAGCRAGTGALSVSAKYSGSVRLKQFPKYSAGFNLSYERILGYIEGLVPSNVGTTIVFGTAGAHARYQINSQLAFQPEFSLLYGQQDTKKLIKVSTVQYQPGFQVITTSYYEQKTSKKVVGGHLEQHLFYYPKKVKPLVIGFSVFERFLDAEYYDEDMGAALYLGLLF